MAIPNGESGGGRSGGGRRESRKKGDGLFHYFVNNRPPRHRATNGGSGLLEMALVAPVVGLEAWLPYLRHLKMQLHGFGFRAVACVPIFNSRVSCICA